MKHTSSNRVKTASAISFVAVALIVAVPHSAFAVQRWIRWYGGRTQGGTGAVGHYVCPAPDGGFVVGAAREGLWILRTDCDGDSLWCAAALTGDAGAVLPWQGGHWLVVGGYYNDILPDTAGTFVAKLTDIGGFVWTHVYYDSSVQPGHRSTALAPDGGFLTAGLAHRTGTPSCSSKGYVMRFDSTGEHLWDRIYDGLGYGELLSVVPIDDGYVLAGWTEVQADARMEAWLMRISDSGQVVWSRTYRKSILSWQDFDDVVRTPDGGYAAAGHLDDETNTDFWLVKTDSLGNEQWRRTYGGPQVDGARGICLAPDGGYVLTGQTMSFGAGWSDVWLVKTDENGELQWSRTFGGTDWDDAFDVKATPDSGYVITGQSSSGSAGPCSVYLIKTDALGLTAVGEFPPRSASTNVGSAWVRVASSLSAVGDVHVRYQVPIAGPAELSLFDPGGRRLAVISDGWRTPGEHRASFRMPERRGVYYIRLATPTSAATAKLVVVAP